MEIIGRDKITQSGENNLTQIDNQEPRHKKAWYEIWWGILLMTILGGIIVGLFLFFTGTN